MSRDKKTLCYVDPDPFAVTMMCIAGASLLLQFIQVVGSYVSKKESSQIEALLTLKRMQRRERLDHCVNHVGELKKALNKVTRAIEKGAKQPDQEFYDLKFKIGAGILKLEAEYHAEYSQNLSDAFAQVGVLSLWINQIFAFDLELAGQIGESLMANLADSAENINNLMASGATNRQLIFESRKVIEIASEILAKLYEGN